MGQQRRSGHTAWRTRCEVLLGVVEDRLRDDGEVPALLAGFRDEELVALVTLRRASGAALREAAAGLSMLGVDALAHTTGGRVVAGGERDRVVAVLSARRDVDRRPRDLPMCVVPLAGRRLLHARAFDLPDGGGAASRVLVDALASEPAEASDHPAVVTGLESLGHDVHVGPAAQLTEEAEATA